MVDAENARRRDGHSLLPASVAPASLSPAQMRARARHHRETAARLFNARLERVLIAEAEALERRAATLEMQSTTTVEADRPDDRPGMAAARPRA